MKITKFILDNSLAGFDKFTIVDIGARGHDLKGIQVLENKLHYLAFEPDQKECNELNNKSSQYKGHFKYYPTALSGNSDKRKFFVTMDAACSSLLKPSKKVVEFLNLEDKLEIKKEIELETTTLDLWHRTAGINSVDYIKIDVQGAELEILKAGSNLLKNCIVVFTEVEFVEVYSDQPLFCDMNAFMKENDFILYDILKVKAKRKNATPDLKSNGQLVWGDAIYFKNIDSVLVENNDSSNYQTLVKYIVLAEYFNLMDYGIYLIDRVLDSSIIKSDGLLDNLKRIKQQIIDEYNVNKRLSRLDKVIIYLYRFNFMANVFSRLFLSLEKNKLARGSMHSKYFWRE